MVLDYEYLSYLQCGVQCNNLLMTDDYIYDAFGFCAGAKIPTLKNKSKRGFKCHLNQYDIKKNAWKTLAKLQLSSRMGAIGVTYKNDIYIWGGFSYTPLTSDQLRHMTNLPAKSHVLNYSDGMKISVDKNQVVTQVKLPNLPYNYCFGNAVVIDHYVYFLGGCYYTRKGYDCNYQTNDVPIGKTFYRLDLDNLMGGYEMINNFPGLPTFMNNMFYADEHIYIMGGKTNTINNFIQKNGIELRPMNLIENWKYHLVSRKWSKLALLPINIVNYTALPYKDKIYLFGGVRYNLTRLSENPDNVVSSDEIIHNEFLLPYGKISDKKVKTIQNIAYSGNFSNLIISYDIKSDQYTILDTRLPINIVTPSMTVKDNNIYFGGGEANNCQLVGVNTGIHPFHFLKITIN